MLDRVAELLHFEPRTPENRPSGLLFAMGPTVPSDGASGYATGCLFQHTDGGEGTALYVNEGSATSADFNAVSALTAAQKALLGATAGTAAASKALIADANIDLTGLRNLTLTGTLTGLLAQNSVARTATADGTTTGTIAAAGTLQHVAVTSGNSAHIVILPAPTPGTIVILHVGANGYELKSSAPSTVAINGGTGSAVSSTVAANRTIVAICASATSWKAFGIAGDGTLAALEAAH